VVKITASGFVKKITDKIRMKTKKACRNTSAGLIFMRLLRSSQ
jgi:hypothetical protein